MKKIFKNYPVRPGAPLIKFLLPRKLRHEDTKFTTSLGDLSKTQTQNKNYKNASG